MSIGNIWNRAMHRFRVRSKKEEAGLIECLWFVVLRALIFHDGESLLAYHKNVTFSQPRFWVRPLATSRLMSRGVPPFQAAGTFASSNPGHTAAMATWGVAQGFGGWSVAGDVWVARWGVAQLAA